MTFQLTSNIKKIDHPYVEPQVQDTETIEVETKKEEEDFNDLKIKFGQIDNAVHNNNYNNNNNNHKMK